MFTTILVQPIYNLFIAILGIIPGGDVGFAIIVLTFLMRLVLYPVFTASIRTQMGMQAMQGDLDVLKDKHRGDKETLAREQMALFKKHKVNPLSAFGALIIQLVVIIALYYALFREGFPLIKTELLYPFVHAPAAVSSMFFGVDLLVPHHVIIAALAAVSQFGAIWLTLSRTTLPKGNDDKAAAARMQQQMMLYLLPAVMAVTGYIFAGAVGVYFIATSVFSIGQEWVIRRQLRK